MAILLGAFLFWLALRGRLGLYAGFATTEGTGSNPFSGFTIPVSLGGTGVANPGGATSPGQQNTPGGGAGLIGPQNAGGGYTPDPSSPNVLIPNNSPNIAWGGVSMQDLINEAAGNTAAGAPGL